MYRDKEICFWRWEVKDIQGITQVLRVPSADDSGKSKSLFTFYPAGGIIHPVNKAGQFHVRTHICKELVVC